MYYSYYHGTKKAPKGVRNILKYAEKEGKKAGDAAFNKIMNEYKYIQGRH